MQVTFNALMQGLRLGAKGGTMTLGHAETDASREVALCLQGMAAAGYTITITGHSLGAGAAAMIGLLLKRRGVKVRPAGNDALMHFLEAAQARDLCGGPFVFHTIMLLESEQSMLLLCWCIDPVVPLYTGQARPTYTYGSFSYIAQRRQAPTGLKKQARVVHPLASRASHGPLESSRPAHD